MLLGLLQWALDDATGSELSFELELSVWMRRSGVDPGTAMRSMFDTREALIVAGHLDPATEPTPLVGRSHRSDVVNMARYLVCLLGRASSSTGARPAVVVDRAVDLVNDAPHRALGPAAGA
jgi:hypothetical protein